MSYFLVIEMKMVGEHSKREPQGGAEKWKSRTKVWERLEKGGIARYIEKLHGFDKEVTNIMVNSWKAGHMKIDGVSHQINVDIIA